MDVRRLRTAKRRKEEKLAEKNQIHLERVLGLTILSNAGLACSPTTGTIAYPAGCTIVLYNARKNRQFFITNPSRKTFTSLDFSEDGNHMVTGECGHQPHVRVWDVHDRSLLVEFPGHKYGINCVSFAPNGKYVVSVGSQHDMIVNVWDWRGNVKVASNKISAKVKAVSFAENGNYFVTAGNRHVKFWYLEYSRSKYQEPTPLTGRSAILGEQRNNYFCDVACGRGEMGDSTFAITKSGLLCEFNNRRLLDKWVELRTSSANCLTVGEDFIFIGCADGIIRCFSPHTLQFITTLPRTHYLGVDVSKGLTINHMSSHPANSGYPDATAIVLDKSNFKVTVVYNDHSVYIWDVRDINKVGKSHSFLFHSACIWGLEMYPSSDPAQPSLPLKTVLPPGSFVTCSSDDTIRIWNLNNNMANNTLYKRNIYSEELLKMIYVDPRLEFIKDADATAGKTDTDGGKEGKESGGNGGNGGQGGGTGGGGNSTTVYDQRNGVRCIRISPDGKHLASGDRAGNIRIHELQFMDEMCKIEAHDAEVLCLEYSDSCQLPNSKKSKSLLASASRDRLIHVFNATRDYGFLHTLDDHSSSITAIRFLRSNHGGVENQETSAPPRNGMQMVSCGADKSIIFRDISLDEKGQPEFQRINHIVGKTTLYDMEIDYENQQILTACQDRNIRVYAVESGKHSKTFKGSQSDDGTLIKVVLDSSGSYAATSCTDKTLAIYDYTTGEVAATMFGHSELVTGLKFTHDCKHLISVSGDGCIFIWRLPVSMTANMLNRLHQLNGGGMTHSVSMDHSGVSSHNTSSLISHSKPGDHHLPRPVAFEVNDENGDYNFNVGQLPVWAKKQIGGNQSSASSQQSTPVPPVPLSNSAAANQQVQDTKSQPQPKGRWGISASSNSSSNNSNLVPFQPPGELEPAGDPSGILAASGGSYGNAQNKEPALEVGQTLPGRKGSMSYSAASGGGGVNKGLLDFPDSTMIDEDYNSMSEIEYNNLHSRLPGGGYSPYGSQGPNHLSTQGSSNSRSGPPSKGRVAHLKANGVTQHPQRPLSAGADADSSLGSLNVESTAEHDGDIDEYTSDGLTTGYDDGGESTEPEHPDKTLFFNTSANNGEDFPVTAITAEELKRGRRVNGGGGGSGSSVRSSGPGGGHRKSVRESAAVDQAGHPSQESDLATEDDEVSTPSGDHPDRTIMAASGVTPMSSAISTENVDLLGRRAQFMKSNFESLSGGGVDDGGDDGGKSGGHGGKSISNRYRETGSALERNAATIARAQSFRDQEQNQRRELLQKRIEETRGKLQDIGYRSMMRGSQSISDLTNTTDTSRFMVNDPNPSQFSSGLGSRPTSAMGSVHPAEPLGAPGPAGMQYHHLTPSSTVQSNMHQQHHHNQNTYATQHHPAAGTQQVIQQQQSDQQDPASALRRVCSLSDLTKSGGGGGQRRMLPAPPMTVSGKKSSTGSRLVQPPAQLQQSSSSIKLRRSSRSENLNSPSNEEVPSYMRSTSASTKKERSAVPLTPLGGARIRPSSATPSAGGNGGGPPGMAQSIGAAEAGVLRGSGADSTSEEEETSSMSSSRRRSNSHDRRNSSAAGPVGGAAAMSSSIPLSGGLDAKSGGAKERKSSKSSLIGNPGLARSERDLTKVTKVRVRSAGSARDLTQLDPMSSTTTTSATKGQARPKMKTTTMIVGSDPLGPPQPQGSIDVLHAPLEWRLVEQTRASLQEASDNLIQLYKRISLDHSLDEGLRHRFLQDLVSSADLAQATLRPLAQPHQDSNGRGAGGSNSQQQQQHNFAPNKGPSWC